MELPIYQVDAFTDRLFGGNPAAVCPLSTWLPDDALQALAAENNLSETAFLVPDGDRFHLRWFTPTVEVPLCGHATLAAAFIIMTRLQPGRSRVGFTTRVAGELAVERDDAGRYVLNFPAREATKTEPPAGLLEALGSPGLLDYGHSDYGLVVLRSEEAVRKLSPDLAAIARLGDPIIVTAATDGAATDGAATDGPAIDFVSRMFAPAQGIPEDPVTGSAHCTLVPYWARKLGKVHLEARQVSGRGGVLSCRLAGDRVFIAGTAVLYMEGTVHL